MTDLDHRRLDLSWKSRKLAFAAGTSLMMAALAVISAAWPRFTVQIMDSTQNSLLMCLTAYLGVNLGSRWTARGTSGPAPVFAPSSGPGSTPPRTQLSSAPSSTSPSKTTEEQVEPEGE